MNETIGVTKPGGTCSVMIPSKLRDELYTNAFDAATDLKSAFQ